MIKQSLLVEDAMTIDCQSEDCGLTAAYAHPLATRAPSPRPAVIFDRDGVICWDDDYVGTIDRFELTPGIIDFMKRLRDEGYVFVIATNQGGAARAKNEQGDPHFTEANYRTLRAHLRDILARDSLHVDLELGCFAHNKDDGKTRAGYYNQSHPWRKPQPGMILYAAEKLNIDLAQSVLIGDKTTDVQTGLASGIGLNILFTAGFNRKKADDCLSHERAQAFIDASTARKKLAVASTFDEAIRHIDRFRSMAPARTTPAPSP